MTWILFQLRNTIQFPLSIVKLKPKAIFWGCIYLSISFLFFGGILFFISNNEIEIRKVILGYLFPDSWHSTISWITNNFFTSIKKEILSNAIISIILIINSALLFPLKEKLSYTFEKESLQVKKKFADFSIFIQVLEEIKIILFVITMQMIIFWIGYFPNLYLKNLSLFLSYFVLFLSFAIDFIAPTLQRHKTFYSVIIKQLFKNLPLTIIFGAFFALPSIIVSHYLISSEISLTIYLLLLFLVNIISLFLAIISGTFIGSKLLETKNNFQRTNTGLRFISWIILISLFSLNSLLFYRLGVTVHHKSPILKTQFSIDKSSFQINKSSIKDLLKGKIQADLSFKLNIYNPTNTDLEIEKSIFKFFFANVVLYELPINNYHIPSKKSISKQIKFGIDYELLKKLQSSTHSRISNNKKKKQSTITKIINVTKNLINNTNELSVRAFTSQLKAVLYIEIMKNFSFPVYIL